VDRPLRLCIINGYPKTSRERFARDGVPQPDALFRDLLKRRAPAATTETVFIADPGASLPKGSQVSDFDAFMWTGSDLSAYDSEDERVTRQITLCKRLFSEGAKSWGSCWGLQIAVVAAGGEVAPMPKGREWGFAKAITLTGAGKTSPLYQGKDEPFDAFVMHLDEVTRLPQGSQVLSSNAHCSVQAAIVENGGTFWAVQYHPEFTHEGMSALVRARDKALIKEGFFKDAEAVAKTADDIAQAATDRSAAEHLGLGASIALRDQRERELSNWLSSI